MEEGDLTVILFQDHYKGVYKLKHFAKVEAVLSEGGVKTVRSSWAFMLCIPHFSQASYSQTSFDIYHLEVG